MQKLPHHYHARAHGLPTGSISTHTEGLTAFNIAAPM